MALSSAIKGDPISWQKKTVEKKRKRRPVGDLFEKT